MIIDIYFRFIRFYKMKQNKIRKSLKFINKYLSNKKSQKRRTRLRPDI